MGNKINEAMKKRASNDCSVSDFFIVPEIQKNSNVPESDVLSVDQCTKLQNGPHSLVTNKSSSHSAQPRHVEKTLQLFAVLHSQTILYSFDNNTSTSLLSFEFDAKKPVTITLYFFIKENSSEKISQSNLYLLPPLSSFHALCGKQQYTHELPNRFQIILKQLETLQNLHGILPIVIEFVTPQDDRVYYTYCKWNATRNNLQCVKQSLHLSSNIITINSLYGLEVSSSSSTQDKCSNVSSLNVLDCVICLTSRSTHVILPCNHLCICDFCIGQFKKNQRRCPMCREHYTNIVKLFNPSIENASLMETT